MKAIKTQTVYICPETGKKCRSRAEAERSAAAAIKAKEDAKIAAEQKKLAEQSNLEKQDWVRLNATSVEEIPKLIEEKAKEFWGIDCQVQINVSFGNVGNTHSAPIGKKTNWSGRDKDYPTSFLGWSGRVVAHVSNYKKKAGSFDSVSNILFNDRYSGIGFRGFHTGTGCPGDVGGEYPMDIGFNFFLDDFPILAEKYKKFSDNTEIVNNYNSKIISLKASALTLANSDPDVVALNAQISKLSQERYERHEKTRKLHISNNIPSQPEICEDYDKLDKIFRSYLKQAPKFMDPYSVNTDLDDED